MVVSVPERGMFTGIYEDLLTAPAGGQIIQAMTQINGSGMLGDIGSFVKVSCDFEGHGFSWAANGTQGMGIGSQSNLSGTVSFPYFPKMLDGSWWEITLDKHT